MRFLQLWGQPLLDDEWHAAHFVVGRKLGWLCTHFSIPGATCIPLNVYGKLLLDTVGWNELLLRLPSLVAGLLMLFVLQRLLVQLVGSSSAVRFQWLVAISPLLVLYSRVNRPYSPTAFLGFCALLAGGLWLSTGRRDLRWLFLGTGLAAIEFHLFAATAVFLPLLVGWMLAGLGADRAKAWGCQISRRELAWTSAWLLAGSLLLQAWPFVASARSTLGDVAGQGHLMLRTLGLALKLTVGTHSWGLALVAVAVAAWGAIRLFRLNPAFALIIVGSFPAYLLAAIAIHPRSIEAPLVLVRYGIVCVPVFLLLVAHGLTGITAKGRLWRGVGLGVSAALLAGGFWTGPLPELFRFPNSFTAHTVHFQFHTKEDHSQSLDSELRPANVPKRVVTAGEVSPYYLELAKGDRRPIIEFPMMAGDHRNPFYFYQQVHKRPVLIGYVPRLPSAPTPVPGMIYGNTYIDQILSPLSSDERRGLKTLVDLSDPTSVARSGASHLIFHRHLAFPGTYPPALFKAVFGSYQQILGPPVYIDSEMAVFALTRP